MLRIYRQMFETKYRPAKKSTSFKVYEYLLVKKPEHFSHHNINLKKKTFSYKFIRVYYRVENTNLGGRE